MRFGFPTLAERENVIPLAARFEFQFGVCAEYCHPFIHIDDLYVFTKSAETSDLGTGRCVEGGQPIGVLRKRAPFSFVPD